MTRKLLASLAAAAMVLSLAGVASAGNLDVANSFSQFKLGSIPAITIGADSSTNPLTDITLTDDGFGGHIVTEAASVFHTTNYWVNSAAFTGFPALSNLKISFHAGAATFADGFTAANSIGPGLISGLGGQAAITGNALLIAGGFQYNIPLSVLGFGGTAVVPNVLGNTIKLEGEPYGTNFIQITGITTNLLYVPGRGQSGVPFTMNLTTAELVTATEVRVAGNPIEVNTVTVNGFNNLASASQPGVVKLVSPYRIATGNLAGNVAGALYTTFQFVPEPGTVLLLVSGAVGLAVIGRNRMRK